MKEQSLEELVSRQAPNACFVQNLGKEIQRAAQQRLGRSSTTPFYQMVIELRKLVVLLRKTLVPVQPRAAFVERLGVQIEANAGELLIARQERMRWLMLGGLLGSALSLIGVVAAFLLKRRHDRPQAKKPVGLS
mgnify:CR=1 FL=1